MRRNMSKVLSVALAVVMLFTITMVGSFATEEYGAEVAAGNCGAQGDNVKWRFYENGTLVLSGHGATEDNCVDSDDGLTHYWSSGYAEYPVENVVVEEGITRIGDAAFYNCDDIKTIFLPDSLVEIGKDAFYYLKNLVSVDIPPEVTVIPEGCFVHCESIKEVKIPAGVTKIGQGAFFCCRLLENIELPDSVSYIGESAFYKCIKLKEISINENVEFIGTDAFLRCDELERIVVSEDNENYSSDDVGVLFNKDKTEIIRYPQKNLDNLYVFPETVKTIADGAFAVSPYLKEVVFNDGLEEIGTSAFAECISLADVTFPSSLKNIGPGAFYYCESFTDIVFPENIENIGYLAFLCNLAETFTVKSMNVNLDDYAIISDREIVGLSKEEYIEKYIQVYKKDLLERLGEELKEYIVPYNEIQCSGILKCHEGSTAEAYAIENNMSYETIHFYGEWEYDWENYLRTRKCDLCEMTETEALEKETEDDVEIIAPENPDHDFEVDEFEKGGDNFIVVEEIVNEAAGGNTEVLRVFDINLKNHDGVHVQPDGSVKVKLPLDWEKDGNYKVYRVNDDGTLTDMNASRQGSHMVFETDHFSIYVIVEEGSAEDKTDKEKPDIFAFFKNALNILINLIKKFITFLSNLK